VLSMVLDMDMLLLPRSLVVQLDSRDDGTYLMENYVPHGMMRQIIKL
jgi:hypothetical protein